MTVNYFMCRPAVKPTTTHKYFSSRVEIKNWIEIFTLKSHTYLFGLIARVESPAVLLPPRVFRPDDEAGAPVGVAPLLSQTTSNSPPCPSFLAMRERHKPHWNGAGQGGILLTENISQLIKLGIQK